MRTAYWGSTLNATFAAWAAGTWSKPAVTARAARAAEVRRGLLAGCFTSASLTLMVFDAGSQAPSNSYLWDIEEASYSQKIGFCGFEATRTSKWTWGPVHQPLQPTFPI